MFTVSINLKSNANGTNNFLLMNRINLALDRVAVYQWNANIPSYDFFNHTIIV